MIKKISNSPPRHPERSEGSGVFCWRSLAALGMTAGNSQVTWGVTKIILSFLLVGLSVPEAWSQMTQITYGYVEKATLVDHNLTLSAKLDTGAKTASLNAIKIREWEQGGKLYLTFLVPTKSGNVRFKANYAGKVCIKSRVGEHREKRLSRRSMCRPVVNLTIRLGTLERVIRVNLTNRKRFNYPLLLGRDALVAFNGLIDPSAAFLLKPP